MNKKAFTMLELVFVIVVIGILAATILPKINSTTNAENAIDLLSKIRYTQHLAMIDDVYDANNANWKANRWTIHVDDVNETYSILSGATYAKDTQDATKEIKNIHVTSNILLSGSCLHKNSIHFDNLGRPWFDNSLMKSACIITLQKNGEDNEVLTLHEETGYIARSS